jgi:hypothetical protein
MDGLALTSECTSELIEQNAMYMVLMAKFFYAQSIVLVIGMMDLLRQTFCLIFRVILGITKCALIRVSLEAFLLVQLVKDKQRS